MYMNIKPARPEVRVIDPDTGLDVPDEGMRVPKNSWWMRRLRDGDVVVVKSIRHRKTDEEKS